MFWQDGQNGYHIAPVLVHTVQRKLRHFCSWKEELQMAGICTRAVENPEDFPLVVPLGDTACAEDRA